MKSKEFQKKLDMLNFNGGLRIPIYWTLNIKENVIIDFESINEEFKDKLKELKEILE